MHLIETTNAPCLVCGRGNTPDARGDRPRFVDLERDVNWNDPAILCEDCTAKAGGMIGMASLDSLRTLRRELADRDRQIHELKADMDNMSRRARRLGMSFESAA
jgi:hypothetical protein